MEIQNRHQHDRQQLEASIANWRKAFEARNAERILADYAEDAMLFDCKPPYKVLGRPALQALWEICLPCFPEDFSVSHADEQLEIHGDAAFFTALLKTSSTGMPDHPACRMWLRATVCFVRRDDRWQVVHEHVSAPFNPMTLQVAPITDPADLMCGVDYSATPGSPA